MNKITGQLTQAEQSAIDAAGRLYTQIVNEVIGHGPTRDDDIAELRALVHGIQRMVLAQGAARAYPLRYRLLGEVISAEKAEA